MVYQAVEKPKYELLKIENSSHNFPIHFHKRLCIGKVISGEKYIGINDLEYKVSKGGIYIIPPNVAHSCSTSGDNEYLIFSLDFGEINNLKILSKGAEYLQMDLNELIELINDPRNTIFEKNSISGNTIINYLQHYFEGNYDRNIKISGLANKLGYNKYYISHLFKEKTGMSLHQYIIQLKIKQAKRENGNTNLLDIALENGFFDQSHFIRLFKRYEGITPKEYYKSKTERIVY